MKKYSVAMEIAGSTALWTRPDTGDCPVSYPAPTFSAVKGVFESILWGPAIHLVPTKVEICSPLQYHNYQTNYGGPLRKSKVMKSGSGFQLLATVLIDVCYRFYADVYPSKEKGRKGLPQSAIRWDNKTTAPGHAYSAIFHRRLQRGQCFDIPFLGWREFSPSYFGPLRDDTKLESEINTVVPSMLREVFSNGYASVPNFTFDQNVAIANGVLRFPQKETRDAE